MTGFEEIGQNEKFWTKITIFGQFLVQNGENEILSQKPKMLLPYTHKAAILCKKLEKSYERILRSSSNGRTHTRTGVNS